MYLIFYLFFIFYILIYFLSIKSLRSSTSVQAVDTQLINHVIYLKLRRKCTLSNLIKFTNDIYFHSKQYFSKFAQLWQQLFSYQLEIFLMGLKPLLRIKIFDKFCHKLTRFFLKSILLLNILIKKLHNWHHSLKSCSAECFGLI